VRLVPPRLAFCITMGPKKWVVPCCGANPCPAVSGIVRKILSFAAEHNLA
jgi:hypothetical protein